MTRASTPERTVLTLATGRPVYMEMAANLARSFRWWHPDGDIGFTIATDAPERVPRDLRGVEVIAVDLARHGGGLRSKLFLDEIAPAPHTLFLDADCLCVGPLSGVFERFAGRAVSVVGRAICGGEWFGDVAALCRRLGVDSIHRFNGGLYYVEPGAAARKVFATARSLADNYDDLGFVRLRGEPNDEVVVGAAMALHGAAPLPDDGRIMNSVLAAPGGIGVDVLGGCALLCNPRSHPRHNTWYALEEMHPRVVHFLGYAESGPEYRREALRLRLVGARGWSVWAARAFSTVTIDWPLRLCLRTKNLLRPAWHRMFGVRAARRSSRV